MPITVSASDDGVKRVITNDDIVAASAKAQDEAGIPAMSAAREGRTLGENGTSLALLRAVKRRTLLKLKPHV